MAGHGVRDIAMAVARFAMHAQESHQRCHALQYELDMARSTMAQIVTQQQGILATTNRELIEQYRNVLAYANYLDEHIRTHRGDVQLRYDFDDICESGFNLKLIAQSLEFMRQQTLAAPEPVILSHLLEQTLIALAPSLERRSMRLSTLGVDEELVAHADPAMLSHAVWMLLLGTIRFAQAESTLRLRCLPARDGTQAIISMVISELSPGQLTPEERHAHLARQLPHASAHMFAETIRLHANVQLAQWLLARTHGCVQVLPITPYACEISLVLPLAKK